MRLQSFPIPQLGGLAGFKRNGLITVTPDVRFGDYPRPEATDGVLIVPLEDSRYSSRIVCTRCGLMDSHPLQRVSPEHQRATKISTKGQ